MVWAVATPGVRGAPQVKMATPRRAEETARGRTLVAEEPRRRAEEPRLQARGAQSRPWPRKRLPGTAGSSSGGPGSSERLDDADRGAAAVATLAIRVAAVEPGWLRWIGLLLPLRRRGGTRSARTSRAPPARKSRDQGVTLWRAATLATFAEQRQHGRARKATPHRYCAG